MLFMDWHDEHTFLHNVELKTSFPLYLFSHTEVESHPFELDTMLFMDWRDEHTFSNPAMRASNDALPTFLYAMPFTKNK